MGSGQLLKVLNLKSELHAPTFTSLCNVGGDLLDLPEEIVLQIVRHITLRDWAKGLAQACHSLYSMYLPCMLLRIPGH